MSLMRDSIGEATAAGPFVGVLNLGPCFLIQIPNVFHVSLPSLRTHDSRVKFETRYRDNRASVFYEARLRHISLSSSLTTKCEVHSRTTTISAFKVILNCVSSPQFRWQSQDPARQGKERSESKGSFRHQPGVKSKQQSPDQPQIISDPLNYCVMSEVPEPTPKRKRHGCVTSVLITTIIGSGYWAISVPRYTKALHYWHPNAPDWLIYIHAFCATLNVVCAIALFRWKRWGFYGTLLSATILASMGAVLHYRRVDLMGSFLTVSVLYFVLRFFGKITTWSQLE